MTALPIDHAELAALPPVPEAATSHGEVYTRPWVVEMVLDLVDWRADRDLTKIRLVEPSCGKGAFIRAISERMSESCRKFGHDIATASAAVTAFDLLPANVEASRRVVAETLVAEGWPQEDARKVARRWVRQGDYLLSASADQDVDVVVGNPPYIRLEDMPGARSQVYRSLWPTMIGRADVYVGFIEAGLRSLREDGALGFICADRWMRNQYGRALRELISKEFAVQVVIGMHDVDAFEVAVSAYPAVVVLRRSPQGAAVVADTTAEFHAQGAAGLLSWVQNGDPVEQRGAGWHGARTTSWPRGPQPWPAATPRVAAALTELSQRFPAIGEPGSGVRVGIGVATGADEIFITKDRDLVEEDRLLPVAMARDTTSGTFSWSGHYLVNPWGVDGELVTLSTYPRLRSYLCRHGEVLRKRHLGRRQPDRWYRTIDRVDPDLSGAAKLLLPDMKAAIHPVLESGECYPHHNLYWLTSDQWDLDVLGGLLLSRVAESFVAAYGVRMRGGTLRFQAQYLRMIRIPPISAVSVACAESLRLAFRSRDVDAATDAAVSLYGLREWPHLGSR